MLILEVKFSPVRSDVGGIRRRGYLSSGGLDVSHDHVVHLTEEHVSQRHVTDGVDIGVADISG